MRLACALLLLAVTAHASPSRTAAPTEGEQDGCGVPRAEAASAPCQVIEFIETGIYKAARIAEGSDGLPYLLVQDDTSVVFAHCEDRDCRETTRKVLAEGIDPTTLSLGDAALPWVSFRKKGGAWTAFRCSDARCSATTATDVVILEGRPCEEAADVVRWKCADSPCRKRSRSVIADKIPKRATYEESGGGMWLFDPASGSVAVKKCEGQRCVDGMPLPITGEAHLVTTTKSGNDVWLAVVDDSGLRIFACADGRCQQRATPMQAVSANAFAMLGLAPDGSPVVFVSNPSRVLRCATEHCEVTEIGAGHIFSFDVGPDDRPLFVADGGHRKLRVLRCTDPSCAATTAQTVDY